MNATKSFLIVEDEVLTSMMYRKALNNYGVKRVETVTSGEAAVDIFQKSPADVVLMDICLAGEINGIEAARRILALGNPQIVFMTGYQDETRKQEAAALSPAGYFVKPVKISEILALL